jgi:hypothetical protein
VKCENFALSIAADFVRHVNGVAFGVHDVPHDRGLPDATLSDDHNSGVILYVRKFELAKRQFH